MATKKKEDYKCTRCGIEKPLNATNFYKSYSELFRSNGESRMSICKDCVIELSEQFKALYNSDTKALYELCRLLDVYYKKSVFEGALEQLKKQNGNPFATYIQKVNSLPQYARKTFKDSDEFDRKTSENEAQGDVSEELIELWGEGYSEKDYAYLEKEYEQLVTRYECDSYSQETLFQDIAFQRLDIRKKRQARESVEKELKTLQDLLGSANIKPAQESASMASDQLTFGTLIKKFENDKPIPKPLPEWLSADWIRKYVVVFFFGNLARMMGKPNPYAEEYTEEMDKYTIRVDEEED